jgi:hypothetical protein
MSVADWKEREKEQRRNDMPDRDIFFGEALETYVDEAR